MSTLTKIASMEECATASCPAVYTGADGSVYVQGLRVGNAIRTEIGLAPDEDIVSVPADLLVRAHTALHDRDRA